MKLINPFELFSALKRTSGANGPVDVRVFSNGSFLYGSYDHGREQIIDLRALKPGSLEKMWNDFDGAAVLANLNWSPGE